MLNTRVATKADIKTIRELWDEFYGYSENFTEWFFNRAFYSQNSIVGTDDAKIAASSGFIPYEIKLKDKNLNCAYIAGLVMMPEYRDENNLRQMIADTLLTINASDAPISLLIPHNYKLYEKYGFRTCYNFKQYNITPEDISDFKIRGHIERHRISDKIIDELNDIYEAFMKDKNAWLIRSTENWKLILEDLIGNFGGKIAVHYNENNAADGYILYVIRDGQMGIYEMAYKNRISYESLMGYIKAYDTQVRKITIKASADDLSYLDFCDNRNAAGIYPFVMARINNAGMLLSEISKDFDKSVKLQIIDRLIEDNNKTFLISEEGVTSVEDEADAVTDIGTLAMLALGFISIDEAEKLDLLSGNAQKLYGLFTKKNNYINMLCF